MKYASAHVPSLVILIACEFFLFVLVTREMLNSTAQIIYNISYIFYSTLFDASFFDVTENWVEPLNVALRTERKRKKGGGREGRMGGGGERRGGGREGRRGGGGERGG
jgi:uncharacterized membrane protein YgcG